MYGGEKEEKESRIGEREKERRMKNNISMDKYYSYGIEINLLNVIIDHKFQISNSFIFSDHQTGVCCSSIYYFTSAMTIFFLFDLVSK